MASGLSRNRYRWVSSLPNWLFLRCGARCHLGSTEAGLVNSGDETGSRIGGITNIPAIQFLTTHIAACRFEKIGGELATVLIR